MRSRQDERIKAYEAVLRSFREDEVKYCSRVIDTSGQTVVSLLARLGAVQETTSLLKRLQAWDVDHPELNFVQRYLTEKSLILLKKNEDYIAFIKNDWQVDFSHLNLPIHPVEAAIQSRNLDFATELITSDLVSLAGITSKGCTVLSLLVAALPLQSLTAVLQQSTAPTPLIAVSSGGTVWFDFAERGEGRSVLESVAKRGDADVAQTVIDLALKQCGGDGRKYAHFLKDSESRAFKFHLLLTRTPLHLLPIIL